ncbi:NAD(P)/FAD-dependent oxidoreductase [Streptomyces muensis]|uniref:FAD-dependent oxidoreductase n=1 Tax=Streptomyces muensis TaxID=1077944 RepID=A0A9X1PSX1_STRM4|nr:FAD-dependent oxidoreductase [Streptomyces muensis]MCF1592523.1 FAD-dependent oxidoreductase [Streptomyces muensis]
MTAPKVVIVGAGHAGTTLAGLLRQWRHSGEIVLISRERGLPYQRPPLSKKLTQPDFELPLRPAQFFDEQDISLHTGQDVLSIDRVRRVVRMSGLREIDYDILVLATGARARRLTIPGGDLDGVHRLRTLSEAQNLQRQLRESGSLAIVGGGFIGLEAAAAVRAGGAQVTVIEREERLLARVASEPLAAGLASYHERLGTTLITRAGVAAITERDGRATGVQLNDGRVVACDLVLAGVGAVPRDEIAVEAGLHCEDGIVVDDSAQTSDPSILAIGDVTRRPLPTVSGTRRLESIPSAIEQARQACAVILGNEPPVPEVPWFWSDQHELKLKIAGLVDPAGTPIVRRHASQESFSVLHHDGTSLTAVESVNAPAEFAAARKLIATRLPVDPAQLANPDVPLHPAEPK